MLYKQCLWVLFMEVFSGMRSYGINVKVVLYFLVLNIAEEHLVFEFYSFCLLKPVLCWCHTMKFLELNHLRLGVILIFMSWKVYNFFLKEKHYTQIYICMKKHIPVGSSLWLIFLFQDNYLYFCILMVFHKHIIQHWDVGFLNFLTVLLAHAFLKITEQGKKKVAIFCIDSLC